MRVINLDREELLPLMNFSRGDFALWVKVPLSQIPSKLAVACRPKKINLRLIYPVAYDDDEGSAESYAAVPLPEDVVVYLSKINNLIAGIDIPLGGSPNSFWRKYNDIIVWLAEKANDINLEHIRNNYRLISNVLLLNAGNLFMPAQ